MNPYCYIIDVYLFSHPEWMVPCSSKELLLLKPDYSDPEFPNIAYDITLLYNL